ncbi:MAG: hypothetical protein VX831_04530 [Candidatus Thermoplasmatota archaeon]|nr:hypothetical protein [Candidatus Thermoplasmatota archaeon]
MGELALFLLLFIAPLMLMASSELRFIWGTAHDLAFIANTGVIHSVADVLQHEPWLLTGYAIDFDDPLDRNIAVAVIKAHQAGEDINVAAAALLPPGYELCERHCTHFDETEIDEDGAWTVPMAQCNVCNTVYDLSALEGEEAYNEPDYNKEERYEMDDGWTVVPPSEAIPDDILDLIINGTKGGGEA